MSDFEAIDLIETMDLAVNYNRHLLELALDFAGDARSVLDFGAGNARLAKQLAARGLEVSCVEPDSRLGAALADAGFAVTRRLEDVDECRFDYLISFNVLEHIEDDLSTLHQMFRVLRPGGRVLLYVPAFMALFSSNDRAVGHVRRYRRTGLMARLRQAGFEVLDATYHDSLGFAAALAYRFFGDDTGRFSPRSLKVYDRLVFPLSRQLDPVLGRLLGKNLLVRGRRPASA